MDEKLIDAVLKQIVEDVQGGDLTALQELLFYCSVDALRQFLPESTLIALENTNA